MAQDLDFLKIQSWLDNDIDEADRAELRALLAAATGSDLLAEASRTELASRFASDLAFGTAGLRGAMGAGPARMNTAVVARATFGLVQALRGHIGGSIKVVVGFDGRHRSADFARTVARVVRGLGSEAILAPCLGPTPLLVYVTGQLRADAGIMITASHNPAADNGYKVYLGPRVVGEGDPGAYAQLVTPWDERIFAAIKAGPPAKNIILDPGEIPTWDPGLEQSYIRACSILGADTSHSAEASALTEARETSANQSGNKNGTDLRIVYTAMHGVGARVTEAALAAAGFTQVMPVCAQREPDPDFPTVPFPNPEEAGALDLAFATAREVQADLIIANDPDADRCSAAIRDVSSVAGWRQLSGDEIGAVLAWQCGQDTGTPGKSGKSGSAGPVAVGQAQMARSVVSGALMDQVARAAGFEPRVTLTGFKWISRAPHLVYGYEEAIGYCVNPGLVRDKDGISAAVLIARAAAALGARGSSITGLLDDLARQHGLYVTEPLTFRVADLSLIARGMRRLRDSGVATLGGEAVTFTMDLNNNPIPAPGFDASVGAAWEDMAGLPPTDGLFFGCDSGTRVVVRPSGTEPKLKCYIQVVDSAPGADLALARARAGERIVLIKEELREACGF